MGALVLRQHLVYGRFLWEFKVIFFIFLVVEHRGILLAFSIQESVEGIDQGLAGRQDNSVIVWHTARTAHKAVEIKIVDAEVAFLVRDRWAARLFLNYLGAFSVLGLNDVG